MRMRLIILLLISLEFIDSDQAYLSQLSGNISLTVKIALHRMQEHSFWCIRPESMLLEAADGIRKARKKQENLLTACTVCTVPIEKSIKSPTKISLGSLRRRNERGPRREKRAPREEGRINVSLGPSWCCPPGVAVAVGEEEVAGVVIWNVDRVAVGVFPVLPPSALLSQEPPGVAAPWWGCPPTKSAKVLRHSITIESSSTVWGRGSRGRGRDRGGGANLFGSGVAPANYAPGLQGVAPELREVVNILGDRNQAGTLTGVGPPPGALDDSTCDDEEGTSTKRPPRPLYRRLINYVRQAWTGVKFALANTSQYAHYVFNTLDQDHSGLLSFEDFVTGLSILSRGSIDEKLRWTFSLYDINGDGCITREEMTDIVTAVYELMGKFSDPNLDPEGVREKVDRMFQKMDGNRDGVVTLSEFLEACRADPDISTSMAALDTAF
ncbi:uncharacterized protein LOC114941246 [Nylanderia fulva]|uniref:uncharacterized protein LOC114941246 n=1 Tax=Nylanderia fulva TaxID=613905 RepID=UPI0010FB6A06|nr:uncharacterized protein LOC114941246 [Nylanderia fulva]